MWDQDHSKHIYLYEKYDAVTGWVRCTNNGIVLPFGLHRHLGLVAGLQYALIYGVKSPPAD